MNVLVTGGAGYLGCLVVRQLLEAGATVTVVDRLDRGSAGIDGLPINRVDWDINQYSEYLKYDRIIHLAGPSLETVGADQVGAMRSMVNGTWKIYNAMRPFVFASTCSIYGDASLYSWAKEFGEGFNAGGVNLRFGTLVGPSPNMRWDTFANAALKAAYDGQVFDVYQEAAMRPWLDVRDAARITVSYALKPMAATQLAIASECLSKADVISRVQALIPKMQIQQIASGDTRDYAVPTTSGLIPVALSLSDLKDAMDAKTV